MDSSNERGRVICRDPIDRHVERLDNLAFKSARSLSRNLAAGFGSEWECARRTQMSPAIAGRADDAASVATSLGPRPPARIDRAACVRRRAATHTVLPAAAIGAPRSTGQRIAVTVFDERVDARQQHGEQRSGDRAPQREHQ